MAEYNTLKEIFTEFFGRLKDYFSTRLFDLSPNVTSIKENDDLNNYLTGGTFYCSSGTKAKTLSNCPYTSTNFKLIVNKNGGDSITTFYGSQTIIAGGTAGVIWHRDRNNATWSDWKQIAMKSDLSSYVPTSRTVNGKALSSNIKIMFPNYSSVLKNVTSTETTWTATADCYVVKGTLSATDDDVYDLTINGKALGLKDTTTLTTGARVSLWSFSGFVRKGDVVKGQYWKAFALY